VDTVERWIARGYIRAVRLPNAYREWPKSEIARLLTRMFELLAQLEEESTETAARRRGRAVRLDEWEPALLVARGRVAGVLAVCGRYSGWR
jgi:hypothetical protein